MYHDPLQLTLLAGRGVVCGQARPRPLLVKAHVGINEHRTLRVRRGCALR